MKRLGIFGILLSATLVACPQPQPAPVGTLSSIALSCNPTSIAVAATSTCSAVAKDSSGTALATQPTFGFGSSDTTKAGVSSVGLVTGVAAGSSNITAASGGITSNAVAVTVTAAPSGGGVTFISTNPNARGKAISPNGRVLFTTVDQVTGNQLGQDFRLNPLSREKCTRIS